MRIFFFLGFGRKKSLKFFNFFFFFLEIFKRN